jgi:outer membrane protein TolC
MGDELIFSKLKEEVLFMRKAVTRTGMGLFCCLALSSVERGKNELLKTRMELEEQIQLQIKDAVLDLTTAEENIPITRKAVAQGEENLRVSRERYQAQVSTSTEVLDAQRYLTRARVNHFTALFDYYLAQARLLRAVGIY